MTILKRPGWVAVAAAAALLLLTPLATPVMAGGHGGSFIEVEGIAGVPVPPLEHGYLDTLEANRADVQTLAMQVLGDDAVALELNAYIESQRAAAWWGVVPFGREEGSPFHRPIHGYLAATEALMARMTDLRATDARVVALQDRIVYQRAHSEPVQMICRYSGEPFNTAQTMGVEWGKTLTHTPTLAMLGFSLLLLTLAGTEVAVRRRKPAGAATGPAVATTA